MQLTSRQRAFLEKLFDVYHSHRQPIHYTTLARALGVANSTSYEMLKLLEQKGYVSSEYRLADGHAGPGRSMVLFRPTMKALRLFRHLAGTGIKHEDWDAVKERVLSRLAAEGLPDNEDLLSDLMAAIPESEDPLAYCGRVVAASLVSIRGQVLSRIQGLSLFRDMISEDTANLDILDMLPGFALGVSCALRGSSSRLSRLAEYAKRYQSYLRQLDEEARLRLLRFSREVMAALRFPLRSG